MRFTNLNQSLLDMIPDGYKLSIERDFGYTFLTLRHGDRTQCCRIRSDERLTEVTMKAAIAFMVEEMKKEKTL